MERKTIEAIAIKARRQLERVRDRDAFVNWPKSMCGLCSRGTAILFNMLVKEGYNPTICVAERWPHSFIELDGYVVDITATQFQPTKRKAVYIVEIEPSKLTPAFTYGQYWVTTKFNNIPDFIAYLHKKERIQSEIPRDEDMELDIENNRYDYGFVSMPLPISTDPMIDRIIATDEEPNF